MKNLIIGISGKSCAGKNVVGLYLEEKGFEVWDLDRKAEQIREEKKDEIISLFGTADRSLIRKVVFSDKKKLRELENLIYPELKRRIIEHEGNLVINGATIRRAGMDALCAFLIYVQASYPVRFKRAAGRDRITEEEFAAREASQTDIDPATNEYHCPVFYIDTTDSFDFSELDRIILEGQDRYASGCQKS